MQIRIRAQVPHPWAPHSSGRAMGLAVLAIVLLALAAAGCSRQSAVAVTTAAAANREVSTAFDLRGVLVPVRTAEISSQVSGKVTALNFQVGDQVKVGDVLMQLDTQALNAQLGQAEAGLQSAEAAVSMARINLDAAQKSYDRVKALFDAGAASQSQLDDARDKYDSAAGPAFDQAQAAVSTARANLKSIQVQLANSTVRSPLNGVLASRNVNVGEVVSPGAVVMSVVDASTLKLKSTVTQDTLPLLTLGQSMEVAIDSYPDWSYQGSVSAIGPIAVSTGEVFPVEITVKNDGRLMAGLTAHASAEAKASGIVIPTPAVVSDGGASYVFVIRDGAASKRLVSTGLKNGQDTLILKGLAAGEPVAVTNTAALADNAPVVAR